MALHRVPAVAANRSSRRKVRDRRVSRLRAWTIAAVALIAGIGIGFYVAERPSGARPPAVAGQRSFHLSYPSDWAPVAAPPAAGAAGPGLGALRQRAGKAEIVVRSGGRVARIDAAYVRAVNARLRAGVADYRPLGARIVHLKAGDALFFSYLRTTARTLHTITVIPAGAHSFVVTTESPATDAAMAREISRIVHSFTIR